MKLSLALLSIIGCVSANRPQLSISVRDGNFDGLDGLDPTLSWEASAKSGDVDLSYGAKAAIHPTKDIASLPRSVWGAARASVSGWGVRARAEVEAEDWKRANIEVDADNEANDIGVHMVARAGTDFSVRSVEATKGFNAQGGRVSITPRVNLEDDTRDVVVGYSNDKTNVKLTASTDNQELTLSQQINGDNRIAPTIRSNGDISVEWERRLSDDSSLTANLKPNDSLDLEWRDSAWTATVKMPIDGTNINGANVSIKRDVSF